MSPPPVTHHRLYRRLRALRMLELLNALLIPLVLIYLWSGEEASAEGWLLHGYALVLVSYLLLQGALYWHLKLRALTGRRDFPGWFAPLFRLFKRSNWLLLLVFLLLITGLAGLGISHIADVAWSIPLFALALLEQVNYYSYQLSHETGNDLRYLLRHRRLRRSALYRDLELEFFREDLVSSATALQVFSACVYFASSYRRVDLCE